MALWSAAEINIFHLPYCDYTFKSNSDSQRISKRIVLYLECSWNYFGLKKKSVFFHPVNMYSISFENHDKHELQYIG